MPVLDRQRRSAEVVTWLRHTLTQGWSKQRPPISSGESTDAQGHAPHRWRIWLSALLALIVAGLLFLWLRHSAPLVETFEANGKKRYQVNNLELVKTTIAACGFIGAVIAGLYGYRRRRLSKGDTHHLEANQLSERFIKAAELLGHDKATVRMAGVHAMAQLADNWRDQRQVCIDVLCAYLRMPYAPIPGSPSYREGEKEVRHTIIQVIRDHLAGPPSQRSWTGHDFDFTGAVFDGGSFRDAKFTGGTVTFTEAVFLGDTVTFSGAEFSGGTVTFYGTTFTDSVVHFVGAVFTGGTVDFTKAEFNDSTVQFVWAKFTGGTVSFAEAAFTGSDVYFSGAKFTGGTAQFTMTKFTGDTVHFSGAEFTGGTVQFTMAEFTGGTVDFTMAKFTDGTVDFSGAEFTGGTVQFTMAKFTGGTVDFTMTEFSGGTITFDEAESSGGTVDFTDVEYTGGAIRWGPFPALPRKSEER